MNRFLARSLGGLNQALAGMIGGPNAGANALAGFLGGATGRFILAVMVCGLLTYIYPGHLQ